VIFLNETTVTTPSSLVESLIEAVDNVSSSLLSALRQPLLAGVTTPFSLADLLGEYADNTVQSPVSALHWPLFTGVTGNSNCGVLRVCLEAGQQISDAGPLNDISRYKHVGLRR